MSRPKKSLSEKEWGSVQYMAMIHCTGEEIAGVMQMDYDTLNRICKEKHNKSISEYIKDHQSNGKMSLRRMQWKSAESGNVTMQIWLGKQWLDQKEQQEIALMNDIDDTVKKMNEYFKGRDSLSSEE